MLLDLEMAQLAVGEYGLEARLGDLALRATGGRLHVVRMLVSKRR
jgi:hypothetical protein